MVQRFDLVSGYMQKWPEGEWVTYEDYAALKEQHRVLVSEVLTRVPVSNSAYWIAKECNLDD